MKKSYATPRHLKAGARLMYQQLQADFDVSDAAGKALLLAAAEARQRCDQAREAIAKGGGVCVDRFGQEKTSPWIAIERDSRASMVSALRALKLAPGAES